MLYPSIDALMSKINSKYTLVTISAARARQLRENTKLISDEESFRSFSYVGKALEEINKEKITVKEIEE